MIKFFFETLMVGVLGIILFVTTTAMVILGSCWLVFSIINHFVNG